MTWVRRYSKRLNEGIKGKVLVRKTAQYDLARAGQQRRESFLLLDLCSQDHRIDERTNRVRCSSTETASNRSADCNIRMATEPRQNKLR